MFLDERIPKEVLRPFMEELFTACRKQDISPNDLVELLVTTFKVTTKLFVVYERFSESLETIAGVLEELPCLAAPIEEDFSEQDMKILTTSVKDLVYENIEKDPTLSQEEKDNMLKEMGKIFDYGDKKEKTIIVRNISDPKYWN